MKRKSSLLFLCSLFAYFSFDLKAECDEPIYCAQEDEQDDSCDIDMLEWEESDVTFLDEFAEEIEYTEKDKHEISLFNKAFIGAKATWYFCIVLPYQTAKMTYFNYVHPFVVSPWENKEEKENA